MEDIGIISARSQQPTPKRAISTPPSKWQDKANALDQAAPRSREKGQARLKLYQVKKPYRDGRLMSWGRRRRDT